MSDDWQLDPEPPSTPVIIEAYRGPIIERPKPYTAAYELAPISVQLTSREPSWIDLYRNPEQRGWLPQWLKRRVGDDPILYATTRAGGKMFVVALLLMVGVLAGVMGYAKPVSNIAGSGFAHLDEGIDGLRYLAAMAMTYSIFFALRGIAVGFRLRRNYWRSSNPQLANRLSWLALGMAILIFASATVGAYLILSYYLQHGI